MMIGLWQGLYGDKMGWLVLCPPGDTGSTLLLWAALEETLRAVLSDPRKAEHLVKCLAQSVFSKEGL